MKIWHISQTENNDYDTYDSAVVAAETQEEAQKVHPANGAYIWRDEAGYAAGWWKYGDDGTWHRDDPRWSEWASHCKHVAAVYLGEAREGLEAGPLCASFNAG